MANPIRMANNFVAGHADSATVAALRPDNSKIAISFVEEQMQPFLVKPNGSPTDYEVVEAVIASITMVPDLARALAESILKTLDGKK